ncbi:MAG TPA: MEDS domain-containing protein [Candidatus Limnocylindria bacterium]|nr:MEDS domain-containing protein [Candidatus Limnocylindria bacterium]
MDQLERGAVQQEIVAPPEAGRLRGVHACMPYRSAAERRAAAGAFLAAGLRLGERCVYIAGDRWPIEIVDALDEAGIDVPRSAAMGALRILRAQQAYMRSGSFDPDAMMRLLRSAVADAAASGYYGLRIAGEMEWAVGPGMAPDPLLEYERRLARDVFSAGRLTGLCLYERDRFAPELLDELASVHPVIVDPSRAAN